MVAVGIMVRVERGAGERVTQFLQSLPGVTTLALEEPHTVGAVIQRPSMEAVEAVLRGQIEPDADVLCAWPVHMELDQPQTGPAAPVEGRERPSEVGTVSHPSTTD